VTRLGFAGLGDIGGPMAERLLEHAGTLHVWNRTASKAESILAQGATWFPSPTALAQQCNVIGVCLTSDDAVEALVFGDGGLLSARSDHRLTIVNLSTGSAERNQSFADRAEALGAGWVDAPVSGGPVAARKGTLTIFLGGREDAIAEASPLFDALSAHRSHMGPAGAGQATKLCNQMIVALRRFHAIAVVRPAHGRAQFLAPARRRCPDGEGRAARTGDGDRRRHINPDHGAGRGIATAGVGYRRPDTGR